MKLVSRDTAFWSSYKSVDLAAVAGPRNLLLVEVPPL